MNRNHMEIIPENRFERAEFLEARLPRILKSIPMAEGWTGIAAIEQEVFPRSEILPLDPKCPECGVETFDGQIERVESGFRVRYDCGHVLEMSPEELEAGIRGRSA